MSFVTLRTPDVSKLATETEVRVENVVVGLVEKSHIPPEMKSEIETIVKDVVKAAIHELLIEFKKTPLGSLDANGDGVISVTEAQKMCCVLF